MNKKPYIFATVFLVIVVALFLLNAIRNHNIESKVIGQDRVLDGFIIRSHPSVTNQAFCSNEEVILASSSSHVVTVHLCEDSISHLSQVNDWIYGTTSTGKVFRANYITGEKISAPDNSVQFN